MLCKSQLSYTHIISGLVPKFIYNTNKTRWGISPRWRFKKKKPGQLTLSTTLRIPPCGLQEAGGSSLLVQCTSFSVLTAAAPSRHFERKTKKIMTGYTSYMHAWPFLHQKTPLPNTPTLPVPMFLVCQIKGFSFDKFLEKNIKRSYQINELLGHISWYTPSISNYKPF
jgi:hypothetical protein